MIARENIMRLLPDAVPPRRARLRAYFEALGDDCLRYLGRRPLTLVRCSEGVCFFHKGPLPPVPERVHRIGIAKRDGTMGVRLWVDDVAGLHALLELDVVELHPWNCSVDDPERADQLVLDLDPDEEVAWTDLCGAALLFRTYLERAGLEVWAKTTGGRGLHLTVPLPGRVDWRGAAALSRQMAEGLAALDPARFTAERGAQARWGGKIFVDWLRNGRGASAIGALSPRASGGGLVATPLGWDEVEAEVRPEAFTLEAVYRRYRPDAGHGSAG